MVSQQQTTVGNLVHDRRGGIDSDRHRAQHVVRVTAHQANGIPGLCEPGRVRLVQHVDDSGQPNRHRGTLLFAMSEIASTSTGHSGRTAARR